jgi:Ion channel
MLWNISLGALLTILTTTIHALCTAGLIAYLRGSHADQRALRSVWTRVAFLSGLVLVMFSVSVLEAMLWAAVYTVSGDLASFEEALYFSVVTFTTLGYGDVAVGERWRLLAALQAAGGSITFGWTTALIVAAAHRIYFRTPVS